MYKDLIDSLIKNNITVYMAGKTASEKILKAEKLLNLNFPFDYKVFLEEFGNISFGSFEIHGISNTVGLEDSFNGNVVGISLEAYEHYKLLPKVILLGDAGLGDQYALNCDEKSVYYNKVFYWNPKIISLEDVEYINDNFYDFFLTKVNKEIKRNH
jgi:hypothetical protein